MASASAFDQQQHLTTPYDDQMVMAESDALDRAPHTPSLVRPTLPSLAALAAAAATSSAPTSAAGGAGGEIDEWSVRRFALARRDFREQYAALYATRLRQQRAGVLAQAATQWPGVAVRQRILELREGEDCFVIGTLYKEMPLKPSILDEYAKDRGLTGGAGGGAVLQRSNFLSPDDALVLEDEGGRVRLSLPAARIGELVTGLICAVRGREQRDGDFRVEGICFARPEPPPPLPPPPPSGRGSRRLLAFLCGLGFGDDARPALALKMAVDFLTGALGSTADQFLARDVVALVVAGDALAASHSLAAIDVQARASGLHRHGGAGSAAGAAVAQARAVAPLRELDAMIAQLAHSLPVILMPGANDPSNWALPQQPFHPCLLPLACRWSPLHLATNPLALEIAGTRVLGSAGQPLTDLARYVSPAEPIELLQRTLEWAHLAPTTPDTLGCYPFEPDRPDPFRLAQCPHVLFAANQPALQSRLVSFGPDAGAVRLLCIPPFVQSRSLVLLDLHTLDVHPVLFDTNFRSGAAAPLPDTHSGR